MKVVALTISGMPLPVPNAIKSFTSRTDYFSYILQNFIAFLFFTVIILGLFYILFSGFQWLTSGGDEEKIKKARTSIMYTLVGITIVFLSFLVVNIIQGFFGVPLLTH